MIKLDNTKVIPTFFPDGTSQVWKIDPTLLKHSRIIEWNYEKENELIHLCQLLSLLKLSNKDFKGMKLFIPFLPYARQDKNVSNDLTFALHTMMNILTKFIQAEQIFVFDMHNWMYELQNIQPFKMIENVIEENKITHLIYPDKSALKRYNDDLDTALPFITLTKMRDQSTGEILRHEIDYDYSTGNESEIKRGLVIDDLCDGGATFNSVGNSLPENVYLHLYVSHGIFSKGLTELLESYDYIHTTDSYTPNTYTDCKYLKVLKIKDFYHI